MRARRVAALAAGVLALGAARGALAQESEEELFVVPDRGEREGPQKERARGPTGDADDRLSEEELKGGREALIARGYDFGRDRSERGTGATLIALVPGALLHGAGHYYIGERSTAYALLGAEALGLAMIVAGLALPRAFDRRPAFDASSRASIVLGTGLLLSSYAIDVAGVARGVSAAQYVGERERGGLWSSVSYQFLETDGLDVSNALGARAGWRSRALWIEGGTKQDVALNAGWYDLRAGVGWRPAAGSQTGAFFEGRGEWLDVDVLAPFRRYSASGEIGATLDLGSVSAGLRRGWAGARLGYVRRWYALPVAALVSERAMAGRARPALRVGPHTDGLIAGVFGGVALSESVRVLASYERRDGEILHDLGPAWGVVSGMIEYKSDEKLDLQVVGEYGSGLGVTLGLRYWIYEPGARSARTSLSRSSPGSSDQGALTRREKPWRESTSAARSSGKVK